jgi:hypothetical protein
MAVAKPVRRGMKRPRIAPLIVEQFVEMAYVTAWKHDVAARLIVRAQGR